MVTTESDSEGSGTVDINRVKGKQRQIKEFLVDNKDTGYTYEELKEQLDLEYKKPYTGDPPMLSLDRYSWYTVETKRVNSDKYYYAELSEFKIFMVFLCVAAAIIIIATFYLRATGVITA